jgi:hypothetical protein
MSKNLEKAKILLLTKIKDVEKTLYAKASKLEEDAIAQG